MDDLSEAADQLNTTIERIEVALEDLGLGVTASVPINAEPGDAVLRFGKYDRKWRLLVQYSEDDEQPLTNCSRKTRVTCIRLLDALLEELYREQKKQAQITSDAIDEAVAFIRRIRNKE